MWETWVPYLGWEEPLEDGMATHSSILAWRIPWTETVGRLAGYIQSMGSQRVEHDWATNTSAFRELQYYSGSETVPGPIKPKQHAEMGLGRQDTVLSVHLRHLQVKCLLRRLKNQTRSSVCKIIICQILVPFFYESLLFILLWNQG